MAAVGAHRLRLTTNRWMAAVLAAVALATAAAVAGPAMASTGGEPRAHASARTVIGQFVFNQDRTIRPRRSVTTRVFCPFRNTLPFTWGFRPISPRQPGVVVDAILTAAVPALGGGRAGFDITLANPNAGATIQVRVSVTCVQGRSGVDTAINRRSPLFGAAAASQRPRARGSAQPPRLELDGDRAGLTVTAGVRASPAVFCPSRRNTAVVDVGFRSGQSELVGVEPVSRDGRPGARLTLQNRTGTADSGEVFVVCLQGKRFGVGYRERQGSQARAETVAPTTELDAKAARTPGIRIERTVIGGTVPPGEFGGISARCGGVTNSPRTDAVALGPFFGIGTGPLAAEHFLYTRLAGVFNAGASSRVAAADVRARSSAAIFTGGILGLLNADDAPAQVEKLPGCVKPRGGVRFRKGLRKPS